jgi:hypothetical protein
MKVINQGRAKSPYFVAFQPPDVSVEIEEEIVCVNPRNNEQTTAVCVQYFTQPWSQIPDSWCLLNYGRIARELRAEIENKYPETKKSATIRFLMLREIKK